MYKHVQIQYAHRVVSVSVGEDEIAVLRAALVDARAAALRERVGRRAEARVEERAQRRVRVWQSAHELAHERRPPREQVREQRRLENAQVALVVDARAEAPRLRARVLLAREHRALRRPHELRVAHDQSAFVEQEASEIHK